MGCTHKNKDNCGCNSSPLTTSSTYTYGAENCPGGEACEELYNAECINYTGPNITCNDEILWESGTRLTNFLENFVSYFCTTLQPYSAENVGGGAQVYQTQADNTFFFRTIIGDGVTVEQLENEIRLTVTPQVDYISDVELLIDTAELCFTGTGNAFSGCIDLNEIFTIDYISNVELSGSDLIFTGTGDAFTGTIDLSSIVPSSENIYNTDGTLTDATRTLNINSGILQYTNGEFNLVGETSDATTYSLQVKQLNNTQYARFRNDGFIDLGGDYVPANITPGSTNIPTSLINIDGPNRFFGFNASYLGSSSSGADFIINATGKDTGTGYYRNVFKAVSHQSNIGLWIRNAAFESTGTTRQNFTVFGNTSGETAYAFAQSDASIWFIGNWLESQFTNINGDPTRKWSLGGIRNNNTYMEGYLNTKTFLPSAHPLNNFGANITAPSIFYWGDSGKLGSTIGSFKIDSGKFNPDTVTVNGVAVVSTNASLSNEHPFTPYIELVSTDKLSSGGSGSNFGNNPGDDYFTIESKINTHGHSYLNVFTGTVQGGGATTLTENNRFNVGIGIKTPTAKIHVKGTVRFEDLPEHADEAAAVIAGLNAGDVYKTSTGELRIKL